MSHISEYMWLETDTNAHSFISDYTVATGTPNKIIYSAPVGKLSVIMSWNIVIEASGTVDSGAYGDKLALVDGLAFELANSGGVIGTLTNGLPIKTNGDYARYAQDVTPLTFGTGNTFVKIYHRFPIPLILNGDDGEYLQIPLTDDFSGLISHTFYVQGLSIPNTTAYRNRIHTQYMVDK